MIAASDLVVFHGGYTRMEILAAGLPSVVIPFHSEQEYYGRVMEKARVALVLPYSEGPYQCVASKWKGGSRWLRLRRFTVCLRVRMTLTPDALAASVARCLGDESMRRAALDLKAQIEASGGCDAALDLMEKTLS
jgi:UDP:flavonoid glycosyltransferase YjiC (YdhE family)